MLQDSKIIADMGLLAEIAYSEFGVGEFVDYGEIIQSNEDNSFSLNNSYTVKDFADTYTGMQAILLTKNDSIGNPTDEFVIAFRGTETDSLGDILANGLTGLLNYNPQVSDARDFVQEMMTTHNISADNLSLTGHSLGGIITQVVGADLHIKGYAYNPYGANLLSSLPAMPIGYYNKFGQILEFFGMGAQNDPWVNDNLLTISFQDDGEINGDVLSNLATEFSELIAGNNHIGGILPIFGDNVGLVDGHSISVINKAIQNYSKLLSHFTDMTTMSDLSLIYTLAGEDGFNLADQAFSALNLSVTADKSLSFDVFGSLYADGSIIAQRITNISALASVDIAYRYALANLNTFAITGDASLYTQHNQNGELNAENFSPQNLNDRVELLALIMQRNIDDQPAGDALSSTEDRFYWAHNTDLKLATGDAKTEFLGMGSAQTQFGTNDTDGLAGDAKDDHLYGAGGDDTIYGNAGGDYIEGNADNDSLYGDAGQDFLYGDQGDDQLYGGSENDFVYGGQGKDHLHGGTGDDFLEGGEDDDTYYYNTGDGKDTIYDLAGSNKLVINGQAITELTQIANDSNIFQELDASGKPISNHIYTITAEGLFVSVGGAATGDGINIISFDKENNNYGLDLLPFKVKSTDDTYDLIINKYSYINPSNQASDEGMPVYWYRKIDENYNGENDGAYRYGWAINISLEVHSYGNNITKPWVWSDGGDLDDAIYGVYGVYRVTGTQGGKIQTQIYYREDDSLRGKGGDDLIFGDYERVPESITNIYESNYYYTDATIELISDTEGEDVITGGTGSDTIYGQGGDDVIFGNDEFRLRGYTWGAGARTLEFNWDSRETSWLVNTVADYSVDEFEVVGDEDTIYGGDGNDQIYAGNYSDRLLGEAGNDHILAGAGADFISGGEGDDVVFGDSYADFKNTYRVAEPDWNSISTDLKAYQITSEYIYWENGKYIIPDFINQKNDDLIYNDYVMAGDGADIVFGEMGDDIIFGDAGNDTLYGDRGDQWIENIEIQYSFDTHAPDSIPESSYNALDSYLHGNDVIYGGLGDDQIYGNGGDDYLTGGSGDDMVTGGLGNDTYSMRLGDGSDSIDNSDANDGFDNLVLYDVSPFSINLTREGDNLLINTGAETITVLNQFKGLGKDANRFYALDKITFADYGLTWTRDDILTIIPAINVLPEVINEELAVIEDTSSVFTFAELLANDSDADGDTLTITGVSNTVNGSAVIDAVAQTITFTVDSDFNGVAGFKYSVSDGVETVTAGVTLNVAAANDVPVVTPDLFSIIEDQPLVIAFASLLSNDTDVDADSFNVVSVADAINGEVSIDAVAQTITFTADSDFNGVAGFKYSVSDGVETVTAGVTLNVAAANDVPVVNVGLSDLSLDADVPLHLVIPDDAFTDVDGDQLEYTALLSNGSALPDWLTFDGQVFSGMPSDGDTGIYDIRIVANDGEYWESANVRLTVNTRNDFDSLIKGDQQANHLLGDHNADVIKGYGGKGNDKLHGGAGEDTLIGNAGNDKLKGSQGDDQLYGGAGEDTLIGSAGNDRLKGGAGNDQLSGGLGNDQLYGDAGEDTLIGSAGNDRLKGGAGNDQLKGGQGNDRLYGGAGEDTLIGSAGNDRLKGGAGNDQLKGGQGNDQLYGGAGEDTLIGSAGSDSLKGGDGNDQLKGGQGNDRLYGDAGEDTLIGSAGNDRLRGGSGNDQLKGGQGNDQLYGDAGEDTLIGSAGNDRLRGGVGNDKLQGGHGKDRLYGGAGNDVLKGNQGDDYLIGGQGNDSYQFSRGDGRDTINNFSNIADEKDQLLLGEGIAKNDLWLTRKGEDLVIDLSGSKDQIRVDNWFVSEAHQVDKIRVGNDVLLSSKVGTLISAMAGFDNPAAGNMELSSKIKQEIAPSIVVAWHENVA